MSPAFKDLQRCVRGSQNNSGHARLLEAVDVTFQSKPAPSLQRQWVVRKFGHAEGIETGLAEVHLRTCIGCTPISSSEAPREADLHPHCPWPGASVQRGRSLDVSDKLDDAHTCVGRCELGGESTR